MTKGRMVEHHVKYKELHGVDETVWMTHSEHKTLHNRLRKTGKCSVPVDELRKISSKAYARTERGIKTRHKIRNSAKSKATILKYNNSKHVRDRTYKYNKENRYIFSFREVMMSNVFLVESVGFNKKTGNTTVSSYFKANNSKKLFYISDVV